MFPYHLIQRTPEQERELARRLELMHSRHAKPVEVRQTEEGFVAARNGFTGVGATEDEAWDDLHQKEMQDILYPPT